MRLSLCFRSGAVCLACLGLLIPTVVLEAAETGPVPREETSPAITVQDVALAPGGVFLGQVVDESGKGMPAVPVSLRREGTEIASTTTNMDGQFAVSGLKGGLVQIFAGENTLLYRLWAPNTAPPIAHERVLIRDQPLVRGQSPIACLLTNPLVILGLVATAIAIPLAIQHFKDDDSGS